MRPIYFQILIRIGFGALFLGLAIIISYYIDVNVHISRTFAGALLYGLLGFMSQLAASNVYSWIDGRRAK